MSAPAQPRAQRLAGEAMARVKAVVAKDAAFAKKYRTRAMGFPAMVMQAGLASSVGFLLAKAGEKAQGKEYRQYLDDLARVAGYEGGLELHEKVIRADLAAYRLATRDVLDAATWIKRMCQALIAGESEDQPKEVRHGA